jgi:protein-disulfide isomerase
VRTRNLENAKVKLTRRDMLVFSAAASALTMAGSHAALAQAGTTVDVARLMAPPAVPDRPMGPDDAAVTVIEYLSPSCPHCALFHNTVYPEFKAAYIDTGKVRFIPRPFLRNVLDAVVFMLAEAAAPDQYHTVIETFFRTQNDWAASQTPKDAMLAVAQQLGFTPETFDAALTNQTLFEGLEAMRDQALNEFGLTGTPTFYVNGKMLTG